VGSLAAAPHLGLQADSPKIDIPEPPTPSSPPPPPKDGAVWGTFYPAAPPPPPPPPPPLPFPLAAAAGGGDASGTSGSGSQSPKSSFLQALASELSKRVPGGSAVDPFFGESPSGAAHASLLALLASAGPAGPLSAAAGLPGPIFGASQTDRATREEIASSLAPAMGEEVAQVAADEARAATDRVFKASASAVSAVSLGSLLQTAGKRSRAVNTARRAEERAESMLRTVGARETAHRTIAQAMSLPRFAEASLSAYRSKRVAAARSLKAAVREAEKAAARALAIAHVPLPSDPIVEHGEQAKTTTLAHRAGLLAHAALADGSDVDRFREMRASLKAADKGKQPMFAASYYRNPYSYPFNPYSMTTAAMYGPLNLGVHPFGGPLYANYGYYPASGSVLKGLTGPVGDTDKPGTTHADGKTDKKEGEEGTYNPSAPPFFLAGTGWPYPYFMNPNLAPPARLNPIHPARYAPGYSDIPVWRYW
jgi:hypothetical protein